MKLLLIGGGYAAAFAIACAATFAYAASIDPADKVGSDGMYAFGESLVFLAVFGIAAIPATGGALFFLRPHRLFWRAIAAAAIVIAATALAACITYIVAQGANSALVGWSALAVLRLLVSPLFALVFLLSAFFAPYRPERIALWVAAAIEASVSACVAFQWFALVYFR